MRPYPQPLMLASLLVLAMSAPAFAQEADIVVSGRPLERTSADRALAIDEVKLSDDLVRIEEALKSVSGLTQFRRTDARSANATSQGATLRGLGGNASSRALLLLDGVPQTDPFGGWVTWPAFAPNRLGTLRITRGGGSGTAGPGALAGVIEMESIDSDHGPAASLSYGSRDALDASGLIAGRLGSGFGFISGSFARGDGFIPIIKRQRGVADIPAPYKQMSLSARGVAPLGRDTELQAAMMAFTDRRTRGTILSSNGGDGADASVRLVHDAGYGGWDYEALAYVQMRKFQSRFVALDVARSTVSQTVDQYNVPSTGVGGRLELRPPLGNRFDLRLGGDWRRVTGETREAFTYVNGLPTRDREASGRNDTLGGFAELTGDFGRSGFTAAARLDRWSIRNGRLIERTRATGALFRNEVAPDRSGWETTGRIGGWTSLGAFRLRGAAYLGWRLPTLNELYRPFRVGADATAANAGLHPERMGGAEIGARLSLPVGGAMAADIPQTSVNEAEWSRPKLTLEATLFSNRLVRPIANVSLGVGPGTFPGVGFVAAGGVFRQRQNIDAIQSRGIELRSDLTVHDRGSLSLSYAYTDARMRSSGPALPLDRLRPAQVPRHVLNAELSWHKGIALSARYVSAQYEDDLNLRRLKGAVTLDGRLWVKLGERLKLSIRGENLTNTQVQAAISGTGIIERATPRGIFVGIEWGRRGQ